jgi:hypothetical protein
LNNCLLFTAVKTGKWGIKSPEKSGLKLYRR